MTNITGAHVVPMARVQEKGQVTLEGPLRRRVGIRPGDEVEEILVERGATVPRAGILIVPKAKGVGALRGLLGKGRRTDDFMKELRG